jgi:hypothetical protein
VKKQIEELKRIQREITPKLIKQLYSLLERKSPPKITQMVESLAGLLKNTEEPTNEDVEVCFQ